MTGTSVDGIDLSLIKSDGLSYFTSIFNKYYKFDVDLREKIINLRIKYHLRRLKRVFKEIKNYRERSHFISC